MKVVNALGKFAIVEGVTPVVAPVGSIQDLEAKAREIKDEQKKNDALVAIDIFKTAKKMQVSA